MKVQNITASTIISYVKKLEDKSSIFYLQLAKMYEEKNQLFMSFSKESEKNKLLIVRNYQETISDALEACFSFKDMNLDDYAIDTVLKDNLSYLNALKISITLENMASKFYFDVAERSRSLLATIPRAFKKVAEKRKNRKDKLEMLMKQYTDLK